ncbi:unnamed protein product [Meganyctiphanes norvegica]|uniref:Transmembrane protein fend n=1 Tax=Meganyctiphanes norvegica TaxID=48144 RepID=A0AAV2S252_MEGNR
MISSLTTDKMFIRTLLLLAVAAAATASLTLDAPLKSAQCRAHCLHQFGNSLAEDDDTSCYQDKACFDCWETCDLLANNFPIWGRVCNQPDLCSEGCQASCDWEASHKSSAVPLSQHNSRLTLVFSGARAQWTLSWARSAPREHVVFALFTKDQGSSWKQRLHTAAMGTELDDISNEVEIKLVAVAESGVLSVIITPYIPSTDNDINNNIGQEEEMQTFGINIEKEDNWPLLYEAEMQQYGLIAARVWWTSHTTKGGDYLVTWEVEGGGLKGHLYTDIPEVDLTLWPDTIYHVKVELMKGPLGQTKQSSILILDTNSITLALQSHIQETHENEILSDIPKESPHALVHHSVTTSQLEVILGVLVGVAVSMLVLTLAFWCKKRQGLGLSSLNPFNTGAKWGTLQRSLSDLDLDESFMVKSYKYPQFEPIYSTPLCPDTPPVFTLPPVHHANFLGLPRTHYSVNLYSTVPPLAPPPRQVSNI